MSYNLNGKKIWVTGHRGMVGSALVRRLKRENCTILVADHQELDLTRQNAVETWINKQKPDAVIVAAAKVGGIHANATYPVDFLYNNVMIAANVIHASYESGVEKLLMLGSSCTYPRLAPQPIAENSLLTGPLEPTNEWYAVAKITAIKLAQAYRRQFGADFISAMPANSYGPGDNFSPENSHVIPGLIRRLHEAKENGTPTVEIWGTGMARREFIFVNDLADALVFLLKTYSDEAIINVGTGDDIAIGDMARLLASIIGYEGEFRFNTDKPDGMPRKLLDSSQLQEIEWMPETALDDGLRKSYDWFLENVL